MQSIYNQLIFEQEEQERELHCLKFIWIQRDPMVVLETDLAQANKTSSIETFDYTNWKSSNSIVSSSTECLSISSTLLTMLPPGYTTDNEIENDYHHSVNMVEKVSSSVCSIEIQNDLPSDDKVVDIQIYVTENSDLLSHIPHVRFGRPDILNLFQTMKQEAVSKGENRVAVCVCAPLKLFQLCRQACIQFSDENFRFDMHHESMCV
jgi:Ferric reductase NAD binding domain